MWKLQSITRQILQLFIVSWNFLSRSVKHLFRSLGEGLVSVTECQGCIAKDNQVEYLKAQIEELQNDNKYLRGLLIESKVETKIFNDGALETYQPIGGISSWRRTQKNLTKKSIERHEKNKVAQEDTN